MTNLTPGAKDVKALAEMLDGGKFESAEDMARTALEYAFQAYEARANFVVVGQKVYGPDTGFTRDNGDRVAFGPYANLGGAQEAFTQLTYSLTTGEEFKAWLVPYEQGTPAQWYRRRKEIRELAEDVPLTQAEKLIVRYNPDACHLWGLTRDGKRMKPAESAQVNQ